MNIAENEGEETEIFGPSGNRINFNSSQIRRQREGVTSRDLFRQNGGNVHRTFQRESVTGKIGYWLYFRFEHSR